ncbi:unnamed protein product, partial [Staurois parvus]
MAWGSECCSGSQQDLLGMYLKEFRTEQCPLFLQHKCTQHRPFTCFHWHFLNQRRRRPIRRRDGTFNYSPDVYCTKYDETTGMCPDGDDSQFPSFRRIFQKSCVHGAPGFCMAAACFSPISTRSSALLALRIPDEHYRSIYEYIFFL